MIRKGLIIASTMLATAALVAAIDGRRPGGRFWQCIFDSGTRIVVQTNLGALSLHRQYDIDGDPNWRGPQIIVSFAGLSVCRSRAAVDRAWDTLRAPFWMLTGCFLLYPTVAFIRGPLRRWRRRKRGLCILCGYNLTGLTKPRCPECGTPLAQGD